MLSLLFGLPQSILQSCSNPLLPKSSAIIATWVDYVKLPGADKHCGISNLSGYPHAVYHANKSLSQAIRGAVDATSPSVQYMAVHHQLVKTAAGGAGGHSPQARDPEAVGDQVDDALLDLEGSRHAAKGGGPGEDARRR